MTNTQTQVLTLGTQTFTVEFSDDHDRVWLIGKRGAVYFLREFMYAWHGKDDGLRQVISWKSGQPLRCKGNEVRVYQYGDIIEKA